MKTRLTLCGWTLGFALLQHLAGQECYTSRDLPEWVDCEVALMVRQRLAASDRTKQAEEPSLAPNSTALADRASAPDVVGLNVNLGQLSSKSRTSDTSDIGATASLDALYNALKQRSPFDQDLYENSSGWRRFSLSVDESFPEDQKAPASQGSYTAQGKALLSASRDVRDPSNSRAINEMVGAVKHSGALPGYLRIYGAIADYLYSQYRQGKIPIDADHAKSLDQFSAAIEQPDIFALLLKGLTGDQFRHIRETIESQIESQVTMRQIMQRTIDRIAQRRQYSADFSARISKGTGANLYRTELIADVPLDKQVTSTTNISYDFQNAQTAATLDRQIARGVEQLQYAFGNAGWLPPKNPFTITVAGEGDWGTNGTPVYKGQFKVGIPVISG